MNTISEIGSLLKLIYKKYSLRLLEKLQGRGFNDLRPSFLELLIVITHEDGPTLKQVGNACGLKKQTMTSHVNELVKRGYINKVQDQKDRRSQRIYLTELGERFRMHLLESLEELEVSYREKIGEITLLQLLNMLKDFHERSS